MTGVVLLLTMLNTINVLCDVPMWYRISMVIASFVVVILAMRNAKLRGRNHN